ncbi:hypothetical protein KKF61_04925 [Patescibacteria group bacterium]|nr:hypothetical protein [Patescibacteria group bacterium]MBU0963594.1 hypothetical protein [Patescibacteria group bacterium]
MLKKGEKLRTEEHAHTWTDRGGNTIKSTLKYNIFATNDPNMVMWEAVPSSEKREIVQ